MRIYTSHDLARQLRQSDDTARRVHQKSRDRFSDSGLA